MLTELLDAAISLALAAGPAGAWVLPALGALVGGVLAGGSTVPAMMAVLGIDRPPLVALVPLAARERGIEPDVLAGVGALGVADPSRYEERR